MTDLSAIRTALVVETNYLIASVIEAPLVQTGYDVLIATTPEEAFLHLAERPVHLALIDFRLQHGGPNGLVARLQARGVPYMFCTAASTEEVVQHFPGARIVAKPFSDQELLAAVELALASGWAASAAPAESGPVS
ncbi:MAG: hypothetical protein JWQ89_3063 [Devosia sp.]|uniref:response regulator n=1 Tax=Devosia sp. TaxID=1871048 RepID=UPI00262AD42C|nr:response regulator [Devosia sp.]MDB5541336.1 hypothetical protein [Devosia sp.]